MPLAGAPPPERPSEPSSVPAGDQEKPPLAVLVVDDQPDTATALSRLVTLWGHETWVAYDGEEALEKARSLGPDVVFLDLGLPRLSGYDVAAALRADPVTAGATLIAVSGYAQEDDKRRADEAGFDRHLTKPVGPETLRRLLSDVRSLRKGSEAPLQR